MSLSAVNWVLKYSKSKGAARLVMIVIAHHINEDGEAWPSAATIATETNSCPRQVRQHVATLRLSGELTTQYKGRNGANLYRIPCGNPPGTAYNTLRESSGLPCGNPHSEEILTVRKSATLPCGNPPGYPAGILTQTKKNLQELKERDSKGKLTQKNGRSLPATTRKDKPYSPEFEAFWKSYPSRKGCKRGKSPAWVSWQNISPDSELNDRILKSVKEHLRLDEQWKAGFAPDASTYLNRKGWEDDLAETSAVQDDPNRGSWLPEHQPQQLTDTNQGSWR